MTLISRTGVLLVVAAASAVSASAQHYDMTIPAGGPFSRDTVVNAPFSADAKTTIRMPLPDGSTRDYTVTARYYRNSQGRVRAEMDTPDGPFVVLEIPPGRTTREHTPFYVLDPVNHTYRIGPGYLMTARLFNGEARVAIPVKSEAKPRFCFQTAPPVIADVPDEQRLQAVNAQIAADLGIVTASHRSDEIAVVDYEMTNIRRVEPRAELFGVPADYTPASYALAYAPWQSPAACGPIK